MGGSSTVPMDDIKSRMDALFIFASQVEYKGKHPLRIVQACKSLIGINLESPPQTLLKWIEGHLKDFTPKFNLPPFDANKEAPAIITYAHLGNLIIEKKECETYTYLSYLLQAAGPCHIAEYMIELAICKSPKSFLFCWSALRSILFVGEKEGYVILYHCIASLLEEDESVKSSEELLLEQYEVYCHQFQIRSMEMVRKSKIIPHLDVLVKMIAPKLMSTVLPELPHTLRKMIKSEGTQGITTYLSTLKVEAITSDLILVLDSLRSVLKFSNFAHDKILTGTFISSKEKLYAE